MTTDSFIARLDAARQTGPGRWMAKSPTREERTPSLSIREADDRILLHDFGGASVEEICRALGIRVADLFYGSRSNSRTHARVSRPPVQPTRIEWRGRSHKILWFAEERWFRSERIFAAAKGKNISDWTGDDLDNAWAFVYSAFCDSEEAEWLEDLAVNLRDLGIQSERANNAS